MARAATVLGLRAVEEEGAVTGSQVCSGWNALLVGRALL